MFDVVQFKLLFIINCTLYHLSGSGSGGWATGWFGLLCLLELGLGGRTSSAARGPALPGACGIEAAARLTCLSPEFPYLYGFNGIKHIGSAGSCTVLAPG